MDWFKRKTSFGGDATQEGSVSAPSSSCCPSIYQMRADMKQHYFFFKNCVQASAAVHVLTDRAQQLEGSSGKNNTFKSTIKGFFDLDIKRTIAGLLEKCFDNTCVEEKTISLHFYPIFNPCTKCPTKAFAVFPSPDML